MSIFQLKVYEEKTKNSFLLNMFESISDFFGNNSYILGNYDDKENFSHVLKVWMSGLENLTISQILKGLLDLVDGYTDYIKFPPRNVIEFHSICTKANCSRYSHKEMPDLKLIESRNEENVIRKNICFLILSEKLREKGASSSFYFRKFFGGQEMCSYESLSDYEKSLYDVVKQEIEYFEDKLKIHGRLIA
jgi:hypothetical protein